MPLNIRQLLDLITEAERGTNTDEFHRWFTGSKIVDQSGRPLVVYHGTPTHGEFSNNRWVRAEQGGVEYPQFDAFDTALSGITDSGWLGAGSYFTPDSDYAEEFGNFIIPCYLSIKNPFIVIDDNSAGRHNIFRFLMSLQSLKGLPDEFKLDLSLPPPHTFYSNYDRREVTLHYAVHPGRDGYSLLSGQNAKDGMGVVDGSGETPEEAIFNYRYKWEFNGFLLHVIKKFGADRFAGVLKQNGYDGVVEQGEEGHMKEIVAFYPQQIKSTNNRGTFNPDDPGFMR